MKKEVKAGAAFLDEEHPGWYKDIDTDVLDMAIPAVCICGQLGIDDVMFDWDLGFDFPSDRYSTPESQYRAWRKLRQLWIGEIMMRRGVGRVTC